MSIIPTQACQCVYAINIHRTASTDALSATPSEGQGRVNLVLDPDQCVQHHWARLVQVEGIRLHLGLARRLVWVPSIDIERLDSRVLVGLRLLCGAGLVCSNWGARWRSGLGSGGDGLLGVLDGGGHAAAEDLRRKAPRCQSESHGVNGIERRGVVFVVEAKSVVEVESVTFGCLRTRPGVNSANRTFCFTEILVM